MLCTKKLLWLVTLLKIRWALALCYLVKRKMSGGRAYTEVMSYKYKLQTSYDIQARYTYLPQECHSFEGVFLEPYITYYYQT